MEASQQAVKTEVAIAPTSGLPYHEDVRQGLDDVSSDYFISTDSGDHCLPDVVQQWFVSR